MESLDDLKAELKEIQKEKEKIMEDISNFQTNVSDEMTSTMSKLIEAMEHASKPTVANDEKSALLKELADVNEMLRQRGEIVSKQNMKMNDLEAENKKLKGLLEKSENVAEFSDVAELKKQLEDLQKENMLLKKTKELDPDGGDRSFQDPETMSTSTLSKAEEIHRLRDVEDSIEERYSKLKALAVKLKKKSSEQTAEIAGLQTEKKKWCSELQDLKEKLNNAAREREASMKMSLNYKALQESLDSVQDELEAKKKECNQLKKDLDSVIHSGSDAKVELLEAKEQLSRSQRDFQDLTRKYSELESSSAEKVRVFELDVSAQKTLVTRLETEIEVLKEGLENEKAKTKEAEAKMQEKKRPSNFLELEIADYEKSVKDLNKQLKDATGTISTLEVALGEEKLKAENLQKEISQSRSDHERENEVINALKATITTNDMIIADLKKQLEDSKAEKTTLEGTMAQLQSRCDEAQLEVAEWTGRCEKLTGNMQTAKENNVRKVRALEERIRSLEGERRLVEAQLEHLQTEFTEYKNRAQVALKQMPTAVSVQRLDSNNDAEQERLHRAVEVLKERVEDLNSKLSAANLEYITVREEKERQAARDAKLLEAAEQRIQKLTIDLTNLREENRVAMARLQGENQALVILHQERVSALQAEHLALESSMRRQVETLQGEICRLQMAQRTTSSRQAGDDLDRKRELIVDPSMVERGQCEGSEDSSTARTQPSPFASTTREKKRSGLLSLEKLLSSSLPEIDDKVEESELSLEAQIERLQNLLELSERKVQHISTLLAESETNEARLNTLVDALKEEIRRIRRSQERQEHAENLEYLKNVVVKFVTLPRGEERSRLIPVLQTILRLSPDEVHSITASVKGPETAGKSSGYLSFNMWSVPK